MKILKKKIRQVSLWRMWIPVRPFKGCSEAAGEAGVILTTGIIC